MNSEFVEKMQLGDNFISGIDISDSGILIQPKEKKNEAVKIKSDFLDDDLDDDLDSIIALIDDNYAYFFNGNKISIEEFLNENLNDIVIYLETFTLTPTE
jgi:hypothetical protein